MQNLANLLTAVACKSWLKEVEIDTLKQNMGIWDQKNDDCCKGVE